MRTAVKAQSVSGYTWNTEVPALGSLHRRHSGDHSGSQEWEFPNPTALFVLSQSLDNSQREQECSDVQSLLRGGATSILMRSHNRHVWESQ